MAEPLRIGLLCDDRPPRKWEVECLRQVLGVPGVELVVVVRRSKPAAPARSFAQRLLWYPWRMALFLHYRRRHLRVPAYAPAEWPATVGAAQVLRVEPERDGATERFSVADLQRLKSHAPDVLLRFGFGILKGEVLQVPRHGIWSYHHGDPAHYRGQPPGFWELHDGARTIGTVLQRLTERLDAGSALKEGWFAVDPGSLARTLDRAISGSTGWMADLCRRLIAGDVHAAMGAPITTNAPVRRYPDNSTFLRFLGRIRAARKAGIDGLDGREWNIGVLYQPISALLEERPSLNPRWLPAPSVGSSRSAPFGYMVEGQLNVLYTKRDRVTGASVISRLRPKRDNVLKRSRTMLEGTGPAAYPCLVNADEANWVVCEQHGLGRTDLFSLNVNNDALLFHCTLVDVALHAPTLFQFNDRWWLMGTVDPTGDHDLCIYHADRLTGPYQPHAHNPVLTDARHARPAGSPFAHAGTLYRPVADRTAPDGEVVIMRVDVLGPAEFRQTPVRTLGGIKGSPWSRGIGCITAVDGLTLVDGVRGGTGAAATASKGRGRMGQGTDDRAIEREDTDDE
jgi:hypothetical protein